MSSLLIFTALIDNAIEADAPIIDSTQSSGSGSWMSNPIIWGDGNCVETDSNGDVFIEEYNYSPGISYYLILTCISVLFLGLFTIIEPLLESRKISWTESMKENWQVFAIIVIVIFLWRVNVLITNI